MRAKMVSATSTVKAFEAFVEITRSTSVTAYAQGQIINGNGASTLSAIDLSAIATAGEKFQISSVDLYSSYGNAAVKLNPVITFFNANAITGQNLKDYQAFTPTYNELVAKRLLSVNYDEWGSINAYGSNAYLMSAPGLLRIGTLDANGKLYAAIVANSAYTPKSGEIIRVTVKGYLL